MRFPIIAVSASLVLARPAPFSGIFTSISHDPTFKLTFTETPVLYHTVLDGHYAASLVLESGPATKEYNCAYQEHVPDIPYVYCNEPGQKWGKGGFGFEVLTREALEEGKFRIQIDLAVGGRSMEWVEEGEVIEFE